MPLFERQLGPDEFVRNHNGIEEVPDVSPNECTFLDRCHNQPEYWVLLGSSWRAECEEHAHESDDELDARIRISLNDLQDFP